MNEGDQELRLFQRGDDGCGDFVIARNAEDATALYTDVVGPEEAQRLLDGDPWLEWMSHEDLTVRSEDDMEGPGETKTVAEWIAEIGRGYWFGWA